ncbi:MAG: S8 family serine peptidase [Bacteroidetes bacterium]|nr:S8 family serine peptidase [Bacteroidota bacterium]
MRLLYTLLIFSILQAPGFLAAQSANPETVSKKLLDRLAEAPGEFHSVHLVLADRVDLGLLDAELSDQRAAPEQRSEVVILALQNKAAETQATFLTQLKNSPLVRPGSVHGYWVANAIFAEMKSEMIAELSQRPDVAWIGLNGQLELEAFEVNPTPPMAQPNGHETGLSVINAPALWAMGYTGYGQIALTNDTGVDPNVPALATNYHGNYVPTEQAFFDFDDSTNLQIPGVAAFDCQYHGTHVSGTILGIERQNFDTIGVAFNAQWMGAASIVCNGGTEHLLATFEWSIDPDGNPATADDMPDAINNSWYDPNLDTIDCFSVYLPVLEAMEAAGIAVVFSAGNEGPGPATITPPHNVNLNLVNSFTAGALNGNSVSLPIANFSSRGPSHCIATDSSLIIKPEVSAPGVDVRSCLPDGYGLLSGTSMASPHVSGAILLLKEAFPYLPGKEFKLALYFTCTDLGNPGEDNTYGMGVINVKAAFDYLVAQGHVPVSPFVSNDVLIVDLQAPKVACNLEISPIIIVENGGSEPLTSFEVVYEAGIFSNNYTWTGSLAQKERVKINLPTFYPDQGIYDLRATLKNPNGVADERPLNNIFQRRVQVLARERLEANAEGSSTACEGSSVLLRAEYGGPGTAAVQWYDAPFGGNAVGQGSTFATPPLAQADTFYAEAVYTIPAGLEDKIAGENELIDTQELGLTFDAEVPFLLKSVKVFAEVNGLRQIVLLNGNGEEIDQNIVNVNQPGEFTLPLDWDIPAGTGYSIIKKGGKPLYANTAGITYPVEVPGIVSVTGTTDGTSANGTYYFFYDWQIEWPEPCERTPVPIAVTGAGSSPGASFTVSADSIDLTDNLPVQFTNTSTDNVASFDWNFGDGASSSEANPAHSFDAPGEYVVSLAITSLDGCTAFALDTIEVTNDGVSGTRPGLPASENVAVFPNPVSNEINVQLDLLSAKPVTLQLTDLTGRLVKTDGFLASQKDVLRLDLSDVRAGVYFLLVKMPGESSVWKVVKI